MHADGRTPAVAVADAHGTGARTGCGRLCALVVAAAAGCMPNANSTPLKAEATILEEHALAVERAKEAALAQIVWAQCEVPSRKGKGCGLLVPSLTADGAAEEFIVSRCKETVQAVSPECTERFRQSAMRQVRARYDRASESEVDAACARNPSACQRVADIELLYLDSHNASVTKAFKAELDRLTEEAKREIKLNDQARAYRSRQINDERDRWQAIAGVSAAAMAPLVSSNYNRPMGNGHVARPQPTRSGSAPRGGSAQLVFGSNGSGHKVFLGCLCDEYEVNSIANKYGQHGTSYAAESVWNPYGAYGSRYSSVSACNPEASDPPVVVDNKGHYFGRLSVNLEKAGSEPLHELTLSICAAGQQ